MDLDSNDPGKSKATFDPGWNDPPTFSYDASKAAGQTSKRGPLLNKRVAFPLGPTLSGNSPTQSSATAGSTPPLTPVNPSSLIPSCTHPGGTQLPSQCPTKSLSSETTHCDSHEAVEKGVNVLLKLLNTLPPDDVREKGDIQKRLNILLKMCKEDKLNQDIYGRLVQLATALESGNTSLASNIQAGLMVDHVGLCSSWMSGVRLLVRRLADPDA